MPPRRMGAAAARGEDRIGALPDDLLLHVLSFLPAHDAVRTCVLSRRWRPVWKSLRVLRLTKPQSWGSATKFNRFANSVLFFRSRAPLEELTFETYMYDAINPLLDKDQKNERVKYAQRWIMYALTHNVQVLRVLVSSRLSRPQLRPVPLLRLSEPLISQHLMTLELKSVVLTNNSMDFSSCPALKNLKIRDSKIWVHKISSQSLSRLSVNNCEFSGDICAQIFAPNLSSLLLDVRSGRLPYFPSAVLLVKAYIRLDQYCRDRCWHSNFEHCAHDTCVDCYGNNDRSAKCVLLRGLSNAKNLELAVHSVYIQNRAAAIFKRDMKLCPIFSNLKTLVLNGWAVACELDALICFLQHAPILEKITLQLNGLNYNVEMRESCSSIEKIALPEHLKLVEVRCQKISENVHKFVDILNAYGITSDIINVVEMDG
ncbi:putative F-box/FBD/LRR-repeat protein At2g05300 [Miscanthus floridulus]|uniref:putative F-box/FBD/LRR-repeat protein At2g05300 n=1 Tax=Miscanthus floridulus TaxID=154761 RepID=UPI00345B1007